MPEARNRLNPSHDATLTVREMAFVCGMRVQTVRRLVTLDVLQPAIEEPEPRFSCDIVDALKRMRRLHAELGVNWGSMPLVMDLLERIEELEKQVRDLAG